MHYGLTEKQKSLLSARIPDEYIDVRTDSGSTLSYITSSYVNEYLDAVFNPGCWYFTIVEQWMQPGVPFKTKNRDGQGNFIVQEQGPIAMVLGRLTYPIYPQKDTADEILTTTEPKMCTQEAFGGKAVIGKSQMQEDAFKIASTDALKKAASMLGISRELYGNADENKFNKYLGFKTWLNNAASSWTPYNIIKYADEISKKNALEKNLDQWPQETKYNIQQKLMKLLQEHGVYVSEPTPDTIVPYNQLLLTLLQEGSGFSAVH